MIRSTLSTSRGASAAEAAAECNRSDSAKASIASAKTVTAVERLARTDRRIAATVDQWDRDLWLLNTPKGVVDLRTGRIRQHCAEDHITKITTVAPGGECPRFLAFLTRIMGEDVELITYLRRVLGYALTGLTREHALFFAYGTGANGKSVLLSTVSGLLGDYHKTVPIETFTASNADRHPTDLANLRGARLVTTTETEEGRSRAESRIKQVTGGDVIPARFMRQDFFEYRPAFKLVIAGNHKPSLRSVDEAIRRRFHLIPFAVTIPPDERDAELTEKLKAEWPAILAWLIEGCLDWQRESVRPPQAVRKATEAYLSAEDSLATWIEDKCERRADAWELSTTLFSSWNTWANAAGEISGGRKQFAQALETRGFIPSRKKYGRGFEGLRLSQEHTGLEPGDDG